MTREGPAFDSLAVVRAQFPLFESAIYLNTGTEGLLPASVADQVLAHARRYEIEGFNVHDELTQQMEVVRGRVASLFGVGADEIAFTENASHGINLVRAGLEWRPGDRVIISSEEHPALLLAAAALEEWHGVEVMRFTSSADEAAVLAELDSMANDRTKLIACSHVSCLTGTRLPVKAICDFAAARGILSLIDGCQATGQFRIDFRALGCDFYTTNGHKWLHGPKGSGIFYVRRDRLDVLRPVHIGNGSAAYPLPEGRLQLRDDARRFEYGTRHLATFVGLGHTLDWLELLGWDHLEAWMKELAAYAKQRVADLPGAVQRTPNSWSESSALVSFNITGIDGVELRQWLRQERRILARRVLEFSGLRVSVAYFNTREELDVLFDAIPEFPPYKSKRRGAA